jgi:hypothetical protein
LARQAEAGVARVNPALSGVVELFDDVISIPAGMAPISRPVCWLAVSDEGPQTDHEGPPSGNELALDARQSRRSHTF